MNTSLFELQLGMLDLAELLADKSAMESLKYEEIQIECEGEMGAEIDQLCALNNPGVFRNQAHRFDIPAPHQILERLAETKLDVAVTPQGMADSPVNGMFAQPHIENQPLSWLLDKLDAKITKNSHSDNKHYYFQSQNDNLDALSSITGIPRQLDPKSRLLGEQTAANLWIGTSGTTSRLHNDNFDNIYVQLLGHKRIYLIPPMCVADVGEKPLKLASYNSELELVTEKVAEEFSTVVFPTYNPSAEPRRGWQFVVDLFPGDVLFMPALWYHQVEIMSNDINMSLNYWHKPFDDEARWAQWNFTRQIVNSLVQN